MKTDIQLLSDVQAELEWDPSIDNRDIVVAVKNGAVTLAGHVRSYADKWAAEKAVKTLADVRAIANEIDVKVGSAQRPDKELAEAAVSALKSNVTVPAERLKAIVVDGWITLEGELEYWYQKDAAERAVHNLWGVKGISNRITLKPRAKAADVKLKIEQAFQRHAALDAKKINVAVLDGTITLQGEVSSWPEREEAETAAWAAPGVTRVQNQLSVHS